MPFPPRTIHRQPIHLRDRRLHHERLRDGNGDVGRPTRTEYAAHVCVAHRFYIVRWVQTITNLTSTRSEFAFATGPTGAITGWGILVAIGEDEGSAEIFSIGFPFFVGDAGTISLGSIFGFNSNDPGTWSVSGQVADTGSTLSLMTLTLMALALVVRRFQRQRADRARAGRSRLLAFRYQARFQVPKTQSVFSHSA